MKWIILISVLFSIYLVKSSLPPNSQDLPDVIGNVTLQQDNVTCLHSQIQADMFMHCNGVECEYLRFERKKHFWLCENLNLTACPKDPKTNVVIDKRKTLNFKVTCWGRRALIKQLKKFPIGQN